MAARDLASSSASGSTRSAHGRADGLAGRYRSLFVIGRGGMGAVEAALELHSDGSEPTDQTAYERVVALKRLLPDAARDKRRVEMFLREAKLAKLLDHPNVVRAFDYGEMDGELFLAMEYVEGQALSRVLKALAEEKGELGVSLTAYVLAEVCEGLHAAHELRGEDGEALNLVHRDVSPQNVMLGYDGRVRLLDFGVAKIEAESVTKTGEVKGKTAYMSPEQAMGDVIDRRSDLFGVGAVLFECLALRRMWGDGTDMDVIRKLALEKPPSLETAVPAGAAGSVPPEAMCALYTRLVARDAAARPATAHDVAEELRKLVPQGREEASRALRRLMEAHFGEQAEEQRRRLTRSLEEVAPDQARELRESVVPEPATPPSTRSIPRALSSMASVADATGANNALDSDVSVADETGREAKRERASKGVETGAATARGSGPWVWVIAAASLIGGVGIWRASSGESAHVGPASSATSSAPSTSTPTPTSSSASTATPSSSSTSTPSSSSASTASAIASASASAPASAVASASAPPSTPTAASAAALARAPLPAVATRSASPATTPPSTAPARPSSASNASPPATPPSSKPPTATPPATAKPPPDVDDHPF